MLIREDVLRSIIDGKVTLAFRRWTRPSVRSGGTLLTSAGQLQIASVSVAPLESLNEDDAQRAGYGSLEALLDDLGRRAGGEIYRIEFGGISADPREALRVSLPDPAATREIVQRLAQIDRRSASGPWTRRVLQLISDQPGVLAEVLADRMAMEKLAFKTNVRKLKALGLTISLPRGYRLSPRGEAILAALPLDG